VQTCCQILRIDSDEKMALKDFRITLEKVAMAAKWVADRKKEW
jgi:hypothetical protein